jgi:Zn-finger nucleic acid-binding protein
MKCPRDGAQLTLGKEYDIEVDRCPSCNGAWYDDEELAALESTVASGDDRRGMIDYAKRESELNCPACGARMRAFNYRAYNLELDACTEAHGFWLDAEEAARVRDVMRDRVEGLRRSGVAEASWHDFKRGGSGGVVDKLKGMFRGGRR